MSHLIHRCIHHLEAFVYTLLSEHSFFVGVKKVTVAKIQRILIKLLILGVV